MSRNGEIIKNLHVCFEVTIERGKQTMTEEKPDELTALKALLREHMRKTLKENKIELEGVENMDIFTLSKIVDQLQTKKKAEEVQNPPPEKKKKEDLIIDPDKTKNKAEITPPKQMTNRAIKYMEGGRLHIRFEQFDAQKQEGFKLPENIVSQQLRFEDGSLETTENKAEPIQEVEE